MTATLETPETTTTNAARRTPVQRPRPAGAEQPRLIEARRNAETAVTELMQAGTDTFRAFLPAAVVRPTQAVDYTFDLAEQVLAGCRRMWTELAQILESGMDSIERRSA